MLDKLPTVLNFDFRQTIFSLQKLGVECVQVPYSDVIELRIGNKSILITDNDCPFIPIGYKNILENKFYFKIVLENTGIPCLNGNLYHVSEKDLALKYVEKYLQFPVTVKPCNLSCGDLVFSSINNSQDFLEIWTNHIEKQNLTEWILVEECWSAIPDHRIVKFKGEPLRAAKRTVPMFMGNGYSTIEEIVKKENLRRVGQNRNSLCVIKFDDEDSTRCLKDQGLNLNSIVAKDEVFKLRYTTNLSCGGMVETLEEDCIHKDYEALINKLWAVFPELPFIAIDVFSNDISLPVTMENTKVNETHITPGFGMFFSPEKGSSYNYYDKLAEILVTDILGK